MKGGAGGYKAFWQDLRDRAPSAPCASPGVLKPFTRTANVSDREVLRSKQFTIPTCCPVTRRARSVRSRPKYKIEARSFSERSEVPVSREERNPSVDAALGNQRVAEA